MNKSKKYSFIFAGIGSDYRNYINEFDEEQMKTLLYLSNKIKDAFGIDVYKYTTNQISADFKDTLTVWTSIYICDYIVYNSYIKAGLEPNCYLGYSMGLITALVCAASLDLLDGIALLKVILNYHTLKEKEGMATIVGLSKKKLNDIINECLCESKVSIACENNDYCFGISGEKKNIELVCEKAVEKGVFKIINIDSDFAFHTDMFKEGSEQLETFVKSLEIKDIDVPVISSIDQRYLYKSEDLKNELVRNMYSKMKWKNSIEVLSASGPVDFLEVSLIKTLSKSSKLINTENQFYSYNNVFKK